MHIHNIVGCHLYLLFTMIITILQGYPLPFMYAIFLAKTHSIGILFLYHSLFKLLKSCSVEMFTASRWQ